MNDSVRIFIAACFYYSGLVRLARWWTKCLGQRLIILNYHRAAGGDLHSHLLYLRRYYRVLHLERALRELYGPHEEERGRRDRRTLLAITFDDGYYDNYSHAFTLACELEVPITIFLIPGYIESGNTFWWLEGQCLVRYAQVSEMTLGGYTYHLDQVKEREELVRAIDTRVLKATSVAEREEFLRSMRTALAVPSLVAADEKAALPLKWAEVQEMGESEWISFGAHTMHHPVLAYLTDPAEVQCEVEECRTILEQRLGQRIRSFAYPLGKPEHIGDSVLSAVRRANYDWAVTTIPGLNTPQCDPYLLRRRNVGVNQHWLVMAAETAGVWGFFSRLHGIPLMFIRKYFRPAVQEEQKKANADH